MLQIIKMIKVKLALRKYKQAGRQDAFRRITDKYQGYGVEVTPVRAFFSVLRSIFLSSFLYISSPILAV